VIQRYGRKKAPKCLYYGAFDGSRCFVIPCIGGERGT
ncbi:MAG: hypothetical protein RIS87_1185, partial [Pseudomonadota bacterium]